MQKEVDRLCGLLVFILPDVTQPLIGADFLSHFGLLVDCKRKRLLDEVKKKKTTATGRLLITDTTSPASTSS
jgi:hypothetical protein